MKRFFTFLLITVTYYGLFAQGEAVATFEDFELEVGQFLNGDDGETEHYDTGIELPVNYDTMFQAWTGWAISAANDTETPGFGNQYSAITGGGVNGSQSYAVSYHFIPNELYYDGIVTIGTVTTKLKGCYLTNGTYPYLSMRDGDGFAKKFGGANANDEDFFSVTIRGFDADDVLIDSVEFFLADYRFEDNSQDYIIDEWTFVDLSALDGYSKMTFTMNSSDVGMFGVNTPTYFCMDNWTTELNEISRTVDLSDEISIYPNPVTDILNVKVSNESTAVIYNVQGQSVMTQDIPATAYKLDVSILEPGVYTLTVTTADGMGTKRFVRH